MDLPWNFRAMDWVREVQRQARNTHRVDGGSSFAGTKEESERACRTDRKVLGLARDTSRGMFAFLAAGLVSYGIFEREATRLPR